MIVVPATEDASQPKAVLIMLHGWAQTAGVFRNRTQKLTHYMNQKGIECRFLDAPLHLPPLVSDKPSASASFPSGRPNARAWFLYNVEDPSDRSLSQLGNELDYEGLETSLDVLRVALETIPDTIRNVSILGFSQGAVLAHILAGLAASHKRPGGGSPWTRIRRCILVGGFPAVPRQIPRNRLSGLSLPSLHVLGSKDTSVPPELGNDLKSRFHHPKLLEHDKGHIVPQQRAHCSAMVDFVLEG